MTSERIVLFAFLAGLFTTALTALGASTVFFARRKESRLISFLNASSAGIMLAASCFSLLIPAFSFAPSGWKCGLTILFFLLGGAIVLPLGDNFQKSGEGKSRLLYAAVTLHNFPEGLCVGVAFGAGNLSAAWLLGVGIGVQNFPEGACVAFPLYASGKSRKKSFLLSALSGAVELPAAIFGAVLTVFAKGILPYSLGFAAGAMVAVACGELLPESFEKEKKAPLLGVLFGFALMTALDVLLG